MEIKLAGSRPSVTFFLGLEADVIEELELMGGAKELCGLGGDEDSRSSCCRDDRGGLLREL